MRYEKLNMLTYSFGFARLCCMVLVTGEDEQEEIYTKMRIISFPFLHFTQYPYDKLFAPEVMHTEGLL